MTGPSCGCRGCAVAYKEGKAQAWADAVSIVTPWGHWPMGQWFYRQFMEKKEQY